MSHKNFLISLIGTQLAAKLINYGTFTSPTIHCLNRYKWIGQFLITVLDRVRIAASVSALDVAPAPHIIMSEFPFHF